MARVTDEMHCDLCGKPAEELTQRVDLPGVMRDGKYTSPMVCDACGGDPHPDLSDPVDLVFGAWALTVGITTDEARGDLKRRGGTPSIVLKVNGAEVARGTWDEARDLIEAIERVTDIAEHG